MPDHQRKIGSECPPENVTVHVTGFKKFHGVSENPTETIVDNLTEYMKGHLNVWFLRAVASWRLLIKEHLFPYTRRCILSAVTLQKVPIVPSDGGIIRTRETSLPMEEITNKLAKVLM